MKSREFFNADNAPEDPILQEERERLAGNRITKREKVSEMEARLDRFNFDILEQMFKERLQKTGIPVAEANVLRRDRISNLNHPLVGLGGYNTSTNEILIGFTNFRNYASRNNTDRYFTFAEILIHEENHAVSKTRCWNLKKENNEPLSTQSGYSFNVSAPDESGAYEGVGRVFNLFNEGVTEINALDMTEEYLRRTGDLDKKKFTYLRQVTEHGVYSKAIEIVQAFTKRLAGANGVSKDTAWDTIMRGYFEGEDILREDFKEWFGEILPPGFMDKLMRADDEEMTKLLEDLEQTPLKKAA